MFKFYRADILNHRKSNRLKNYDYPSSGWYFVTICTQNMAHRFGKVQNGKMLLNDLGKIVNDTWFNIPKHYPNVELDEFIIMPNHIHGIIIINYKNIVGDENFRPLQQHKTNLSNVIKGFKIGVQKMCRNNNLNFFKWQRSFYDRIIRNEKELYNIRKYINQNPLKWDLNSFVENLDL